MCAHSPHPQSQSRPEHIAPRCGLVIMAFQTNIFRDGEWVTQTVDLDAALRASASTTKLPAEAVFPSDRPPCGILSSTVTESPLVHKILPVRIRSKNHNDVAFIGVGHPAHVPVRPLASPSLSPYTCLHAVPPSLLLSRPAGRGRGRFKGPIYCSSPVIFC